MRKFWHNLPLYFGPETDLGGGGGGGSTDNSTASGGDSGVTHGTATDALIAAAEASESSTDTSTTENEADAVARATGTTVDNLPNAGGDGKPAATTGAKGPQTGGVEEKVTGPVPPDRHIAAVKNARAAGAAEAEAKYAWAKDLNEQTVSTAFDVVGDLLRDPKAFAVKLAGEVGLQLWDGKTPPAGASSAATGASILNADGTLKLPKGALRSEDGHEAYSVPQFAEILTGVIATIRQEMKGEMKPLLDARTTEEQRQQHAEIQAAARETVTATLTEARGMPHFQMKDHAGKMIDNPKILANLMAIPVKVRASIGPVAALYQAYNKFLKEDVFPTIGTAAAATVRAENSRKVASSQGANPTGTHGATGKKEIKGVSDLARRMEEMAAGAASV